MSRSVVVILVGAVAAFGAAFGIARAASGGDDATSGEPAAAPEPHVVRSTAAHPAIVSLSVTAVPKLRHKRQPKRSPRKDPAVTTPTTGSDGPDTTTPPPVTPPPPPVTKKKKKPQPFE